MAIKKTIEGLARSLTICQVSAGFSPWQPQADIFESDTELMVYVEIPGVEPASIKLTIEPGQMRISGTRVSEPLHVTRVHQLEIEYGRFSRHIPLPVAIDVNSAQTKYYNGFLVVCMAILKQKGEIPVKFL